MRIEGIAAQVRNQMPHGRLIDPTSGGSYELRHRAAGCGAAAVGTRMGGCVCMAFHSKSRNTTSPTGQVSRWVGWRARTGAEIQVRVTTANAADGSTEPAHDEGRLSAGQVEAVWQWLGAHATNATRTRMFIRRVHCAWCATRRLVATDAIEAPLILR